MIQKKRTTKETDIDLSLRIAGEGKSTISTKVGFLDHMLESFAKHAQIDLMVTCQGDIHIDDHHSVEDVGITLGQAFKQAIGDKKGIVRYGHFYAPLDESLSRAVVDISGRPGLHMDIPFTRAMIGSFDVDLFSEFFYGFHYHAMVTIHLDNLKGKNSHHQIESIFKAFARALRMAIEYDERALDRLPSTKNAL